jgi:Trk K+ transport system NAD-binding subunit
MTDRRIVWYYALTVLGAVAFFTVAYDAGMTVFEGRPRGPLHSLEVVFQTFTTTGYGQDAPWTTTPMKALVVGMQLTGMALVFAALPVIVVPILEETLSRNAATALDGASDHVLVCGAGTRSRAVVDDLAERGVEAVLVTTDRETAETWGDDGYAVVHGDGWTVDLLDDADADAARAVVTNTTDETNLGVVVAAREAAPDAPVYSVVDDPAFADYQRHAGADGAFTPRELLGKGLAWRITTGFSTDVGVAELRDLRVARLPITPGSEVAGERVGDAQLEGKTGATLVGAWARGEFRTPPFPDLRLDEHTQLLAVGRPDRIDRLEDATGSTARSHTHDEVLLLGYGVVGSTVDEVLSANDVPTTVLDVTDHDGVDVVGDATDPDDLRRAGVDEVQTIVIALDDDVTALATAFVVRDLAPDVEVIARANEPETVRKLYRAGTDYVLSLGTVSGRLLGAAVVSDDHAPTYDQTVRIVAEPVGRLAGRRLDDGPVRAETGCTPIALRHRDGRLNTDLRGNLELGVYDELVVAGTASDVERFESFVAE